MIRINLLQKKVSKKKMGLVQGVIGTAAVFAVLILGLGYFWMSLNGKVSDLKRQVAAAEVEKEKLKDVNSQKNAYEKNINTLKNKLDITNQIKENRFLPVRLFDELTLVLNNSTPVWLTSYRFDEDKITVDGYSLTNPDLADFVKNLEKTPFYKNVDLLFSEKQKQEDREIFRFSLNAVPQTEDDPQAAQTAE